MLLAFVFYNIIEEAKDTKIKEIVSFVNGIERDYDAVENAVCLPYSNGLAEGSVNKIQVIKRIMYGRCSFETLRSKTILLEEVHSTAKGTMENLMKGELL